MPAFTKAELESAFAHYSDRRRGVLAQRRLGAVRRPVHRGRPLHRARVRRDARPRDRAGLDPGGHGAVPAHGFPSEWQAWDEENGAVVIHIKNLLDHPTDPDGEPFWFPNWTRLVYAGDNQWSSEEDIYNPRRDAARVVGAWLAAGGKLATDKIPSPEALAHARRAHARRAGQRWSRRSCSDRLESR